MGLLLVVRLLGLLLEVPAAVVVGRIAADGGRVAVHRVAEAVAGGAGGVLLLLLQLTHGDGRGGLGQEQHTRRLGLRQG